MLRTITRQPGEPLTLDNFWHPLREAYPFAYREFLNWIDRQREREDDWRHLYGTKAPKVHELPWAMQIGVLLQFLEVMHNAWICIPPTDTSATITDRLLEELVHEFCRMDKALKHAAYEAHEIVSISHGDQDKEMDNMLPPDLVGY